MTIKIDLNKMNTLNKKNLMVFYGYRNSTGDFGYKIIDIKNMGRNEALDYIKQVDWKATFKYAPEFGILLSHNIGKNVLGRGLLSGFALPRVDVDYTPLKMSLMSQMDTLDTEFSEFMSDMSNEALDIAKARASKNFAPYLDIQANNDGTYSIVGPKAITTYMNDGTRAHIIRPKHKAALAFKPAGANSLIYAKYVHHPGTKGMKFIEAAMTYMKEAVDDID